MLVLNQSAKSSINGPQLIILKIFLLALKATKLTWREDSFTKKEKENKQLCIKIQQLF